MDLLAFGNTGWGDEMARAALTTLSVAVCAFALALMIGAAGAAAKLSRWRPVRFLCDIYTTVARGVPELLIIYLFFFGGSSALMFAARIFSYHGYIELDAFATGVAAIALINGAYQTEVFRGAALAVPRGQIEAALAVGMSDGTLFRRILVPQVLRLALPGLGNCWLSALKETALVSVIGLIEIMRQAHVASGSSQMPFLFYMVAACLFLFLTSFSGYGFRRAERWAGRGIRRG
ncbi:MAG: ABC transporter permease [Desulfobacteraceae bacterium]|nr:MAG: ABC transporter permease [Desulfobacteraceae bacterium]